MSELWDLEAHVMWSNEGWILRTLSAELHALPMVLMLIRRAHHDLAKDGVALI